MVISVNTKKEAWEKVKYQMRKNKEKEKLIKVGEGYSSMTKIDSMKVKKIARTVLIKIKVVRCTISNINCRTRLSQIVVFKI